MSILTFMEERAVAKGMKNCPHCGEPDLFFALEGKCMECDQPIARYPKIDSFQFALEVFCEFIDKYDELTPKATKQPAIDAFKQMIDECESSMLPSNDQIIRLQAFIHGGGNFGGEKVGGVVTIMNGMPSLSLLDNHRPSQDEHPLTRIKSLASVIAAVNYIKSVPTDNEIILDYKPSYNVKTELNQSNSSSSQSGCLVLFIALTASSLIILLTPLTHFF